MARMRRTSPIARAIAPNEIQDCCQAYMETTDIPTSSAVLII